MLPLFPPERRAAGLYHNTAVVFDADGSVAGKYRKMHIPDDPLYYEKFYFTPGDLGFLAFDTQAARVGTLVCWDQWYPEGARLTALAGAEALFYPTAIGWHPSEKAEYGERHGIDCLKIVPSHLAALLSAPRAEGVLPRRRLVLGGEASTWDLVNRVEALSPDCQIMNHYGPTEATVQVLAFEAAGRWTTPIAVLQPRYAKLSAQVDF